jgi:hypothetical protein
MKLAVKLFVMMGIFLVVEAVQVFQNPSIFSVYWVFLELYRIPHAFALAWMFIANEKVRGELGKYFPSLKRRKEGTEVSMGGGPSKGGQETSSHALSSTASSR